MNSPSTVLTVITAVPAVAPDGAETVTVLPVKATVARDGTEEVTVNSLLSASSGATLTVNVVLEPAATGLTRYVFATRMDNDFVESAKMCDAVLDATLPFLCS